MSSCTADQQPPPDPSPEEWAQAQAWLDGVSEDMKGRVADLFAYFRAKKKADVTADVMNLKDQFLQKVFPTKPPSSGGAQPLVQQNRVLHQRATYLYYSVLHYILTKMYPMQHPPAPGGSDRHADRFSKPSLSAEQAAAVTDLLLIPDFHASLLSLAAHITRAVDVQEAPCDSPVSSLLGLFEQCEYSHNMLAVWNAGRWYTEAFGGGSARPMPALPVAYLVQRICRLAEEQGVLREGSHFYEIVFAGGGAGYTPGDHTLVQTFLRAYALRATGRAMMVASHLQAGCGDCSSALGVLASLPSLCAELVDQVLAHHLHLAFNQHMSIIVACCIYSVAKVLKVKITFSGIMQAMVALLPDHDIDLFGQRVELSSAAAMMITDEAGDGEGPATTTAASMGDIRAFYNTRFLAELQEYVRAMGKRALAAAQAGGAPAAKVQQQVGPGGTSQTAYAYTSPSLPGPPLTSAAPHGAGRDAEVTQNGGGGGGAAGPAQQQQQQRLIGSLQVEGADENLDGAAARSTAVIASRAPAVSTVKPRVLRQRPNDRNMAGQAPVVAGDAKPGLGLGSAGGVPLPPGDGLGPLAMGPDTHPPGAPPPIAAQHRQVNVVNENQAPHGMHGASSAMPDAFAKPPPAVLAGNRGAESNAHAGGKRSARQGPGVRYLR